MGWVSGRHRGVRKTITFSDEEWAQLQETYALVKADAPYMDFGRFARSLLLDGHVTTIKVATDPAKINREIRRIGQNINQIAHQANVSKSVTREQLRAVEDEMRTLNDMFYRLVEQYADAVLEGQ
ncbi:MULTISPECIES: plasmid mobilization relaxosome protein MobC [Bifidobacterium]|uniref:Mobilization protein n=2 Tax=Bifidobacterium TaxID=1678 RepID=A0A261FP17_9BIFI|nr:MULTISPECIES: plasmid mobilization relaxosome protein MobC [Bifidobacterium]OZG60713.1 mobilization protein [Bifidobacterium lemurum]OZG69611.1 mobilization protein [Bifidobacterium eulemuris]QOL32272.1 plasmid mobilization relaxosome protein MobC [Bifidobacterium eulemuris]QOL35232.1 plasmid mobilization relaxosome protein MobC [Bifidobacterium lemurum]